MELPVPLAFAPPPVAILALGLAAFPPEAFAPAAFGTDAQATGAQAFAAGLNAQATGTNSIAIGNGAIGAALLAPQLTAVPALDERGFLHLIGYFPTRPEQIDFNLSFQDVGNLRDFHF